MKLASLVVGLTLLATPALAADLRYVTGGGDAVTLVHAGSITRTGDNASGWFNTYWRGIQKDNIYIQKALNEYDCKANRFRSPLIVSYDEQGKRVGSSVVDAWTPVVPDSIGEEQMNVVCKGIGFSATSAPVMSDVEMLRLIQSASFD